MHVTLCVCPLVRKIETRTRLVLVIHHTEIRKPTNTGHLAASCLENSEIHVRGGDRTPSAPIDWGGRTPLLLFPHEGEATVLAPIEGPVALVVPDGNWRQASKVRARVPGMRDVRCVTLPPGPPSLYRLRSEAHPAGLATMEAIARALGILDGPEVQAHLEYVFRAMVERTLWVRGSLSASAVTGGLPPGATRHDPESGARFRAEALASGAEGALHDRRGVFVDREQERDERV
jgi:DTW domain-containing protein YfiP